MEINHQALTPDILLAQCEAIKGYIVSQRLTLTGGNVALEKKQNGGTVHVCFQNLNRTHSTAFLFEQPWIPILVTMCAQILRL